MINTSIMMSKLHVPQRPHALRLLNSLCLNGIACDLSETGVGKTYCASQIAKLLGLPVYVICPCSVLPEWREIMGNFGVVPQAIINFEKLMRGGTPYVKFREPTTKVNPKTGQPIDQFRYQLVQAHFKTGALIIIDEAHRCKGVTSLNAGLMIALKRQGYRVLTLSATQATNPTDMRAFGYLTNLHNLLNWKDWCLDHGAKENEKFGDITFDSQDKEANKNMTKAHTNLFDIQNISSRLTRDEMGSRFPDNHVVAQAFDLGVNSPKIQAVYDEMEDEIAKLEEGTLEYSSHVFAQIIRARRRAEMLKVPLLHEMFEDLYDEGKSVVMFLNYTESILALGDRIEQQKQFAGKIGYIYGDRPPKQRKQDQAEFQADRYRGLICNLKCGGASLGFHDLNGNYPRATLLSPSFSAIDMIQALGRIPRDGALTKCYQRIVYASNCIEERACQKVQTRLNNLSCLLDGDLTDGFKIFS